MTGRVWPCLFGLRCARIKIVSPDPRLQAVAEYECGGCGTRYRGNGWKREKVKP